MPAPANVAGIVLNWNRLTDTAACCRALRPLLPAPNRLLVVDNGSTAHDGKALRADCPDAELLLLDRNRGFAGGVNAALRKLWASSPPDYVWLVNNDLHVRPEGLISLRQTADAATDIGIVGAAMPDGAWHLAGPCKIPVPMLPGQAPDYVSGACMLIKREVIDAIGLLDEAFFFFFEDADFCRRAHQAGWRLAVAETDALTHAGGGTIGRHAYARARYYRAGHRQFLRKHFRRSHWPRAWSCMIWRLAVELVSGNRAALRGNWHGWRQGYP